ncbi:MAG: hypothetical protein ACR2RE_06790 [Geminicoccaceae bacterium]
MALLADLKPKDRRIPDIGSWPKEPLSCLQPIVNDAEPASIFKEAIDWLDNQHIQIEKQRRPAKIIERIREHREFAEGRERLTRRGQESRKGKTLDRIVNPGRIFGEANEPVFAFEVAADATGKPVYILG